MRFDQIHIPAFGPFTDFTLDFPRSKYDVHLIYGPNEAGKSSLLRAIRQLLYGIPVRSTDSFLHPNPQLRIGATISNEEDSLTFLRKKGRQNTLLDARGNTLKDAALAAFLGPVGESFFSNMFGLDTDSLRRGADSLLAGEGDLGSAIFSASRGGMPINEAIRNLEEEAHSLFKGRVGSTTIARALKDLKEAGIEEKAATISTNRWRTLKSSIREAESLFQEQEALRKEHQKRREIVVRFLQALPVLQKVRRLGEELSEIQLPELPSDFVDRVREVERDLMTGRQAMELHASRRKSLKASLEKIEDPEKVLALAGDLELLNRREAQYQEIQDSLPGLQQQILSLKSSLGGDADLEKFPPFESRTLSRFQDLGQKLEEMDREIRELGRQLKGLENRLSKGRASLAKFTADSGLESLEELSEKASEFATRRAALPTLQSEKDLLGKRADALRERLNPSGDPRKIKVPGRESIEQEERKRLEWVEAIRDLERQLAATRDEMSSEQAALDHLASQAALYSPADLKKVRQKRDGIWSEILKSGTPDESLTPAIFESDEIADALHRDAEDIARASDHRGRLAALQARKGDLESDLQSTQTSLNEWSKLWDEKHALTPGQMPLELLSWREDWKDLCQLTDQIEEAEAKIAALQKEEEELLAKLGGGDFETSHRKLRRELEKANREHGEQKAIRKQLEADELKLEQLETELEDRNSERERARSEWEALCDTVKVDSGQEVTAVLQEIESRVLTRSKILELIDLEKSYQQKKIFVDEHRGLLEKTANALSSQPSQPVLYALLEESKDARNRRAALEDQLEELKVEEPGLTLALNQAVERLASLKAQAGSEDLESVLPQFEQRKKLRETLEGQQELLESFAHGASMDDFLSELAGQDAAALVEEKRTLDEAGEELQAGRDRARAVLDGLLREEEELQKAGDLAAQHRQRATDAQARIVADAQRFRQLHYAIDFLKRQVENYREKAQGPMVEKTSHFFKMLTGGAFDRVVARVDDNDVPRLLTIRGTGEEVAPEALSEGSKDQLYLSLRLAAIDLHVDSHEPMPLILDDLLMTFDDERASALIPVLEELGQKTQILIFTHHTHLKDIVGANVTSHELTA